MLSTFYHWLQKIVDRRNHESPLNVEELRLEFKARYNAFKILLHSNNRALEKMAEIERALQESNSFGMPLIKANTTAVCVDVYRMIRNLNELTPGRYEELFDRFNAIEQAISELLSSRSMTRDNRLTIPFRDVNAEMIGMVGRKMSKLGEVKNKLGLLVPDGFVITSTAYLRFMEYNQLQTEIDRLFQPVDFADLESLDKICAEIRNIVVNSSIPPELESSVEQEMKRLEKQIPFPYRLALRSSALGEDSPTTSFAGQYHSELNVKKENIFQAYKNVVASKYSLSAVTYRLNRGFKDEDTLMCVGCMRMIDACAGGATYSRNPVDRTDDSIIINAAWGLPKSVVEGNVAGDQFAADRNGQLIKALQIIKDKPLKYICSTQAGITTAATPEELRGQPSLKPDQVSELAKMAIVLEIYFASPQDVEWAIADNQEIYCLQTRPLQLEKQAKKETNLANAGVVQKPFLKGGITASLGNASGPVYLVKKNSDALSFPAGAVMVIRQASPHWAPFLNRAAAVIAEQGNFAGHLANVAREFGVPAIFNVQDAMENLNNNEVITVDADNHSLYRGRVDSLLSRTDRKRNMMAGSPVYRTLEALSRLIVPLHLLDPDAAEFVPSNCSTLHDITRFVHEKSVAEMFNFGSQHKFSERSSKQLVYKVPMQWWILNLDDGFSQEIPGKYVHLEEIASIPMLALWQGIIAIPWEGPPPIDSKGFLSVMFQATTDTALNTGLRSRYTEKNYFMITRNFCSFTSRLGAHFSTIESMISHNIEENYVSFRFKGGAADQQRRMKRVMLLGSILEENGFQIKTNEDILIARLENRPPQEIISRLMVLGYLTIHTRQLDMIMANTSLVRFYREKLKSGIETVMSNQSPDSFLQQVGWQI